MELSEELFERWKAEHEADAKAWWASLNDYERIMAVFDAHADDIDSETRLMAQKPWKWMGEAYYFHEHQEVPVRS